MLPCAHQQQNNHTRNHHTYTPQGWKKKDDQDSKSTHHITHTQPIDTISQNLIPRTEYETGSEHTVDSQTIHPAR